MLTHTKDNVMKMQSSSNPQNFKLPSHSSSPSHGQASVITRAQSSNAFLWRLLSLFMEKEIVSVLRLFVLNCKFRPSMNRGIAHGERVKEVIIPT